MYALNFSLCHIGLVLLEVVQAEWVLVVAVVTHDFVCQWVEMPQHAWNVHACMLMPIPGHPSIATLDAHSLGVDVGKILVEPYHTFAALI